MNKKEENKNFNKIVVITIIMAVSLVISAFLCGCSEKENNINNSKNTKTPNEQLPSLTPSSFEPNPENDEAPIVSPIEYTEKIIEINGRKNHIFLLVVDLENPRVTVKPYLSFNRIFGYEYLQGMAEATGAAAAVNAGFFFEYGLPSGLLVNDGETISEGTGKFYSLIIENEKARFEIVKTVMSLNVNDIKIEIEAFNCPPESSDFAIFSDFYGSTDRLGTLRTILVIKEGIVTEYRIAESAVDIPQNGYVVMLPAEYSFDINPIGSSAVVEFEPSFKADTMAYECASMLVEDGISLAGDTMPWVGNLNHYDPRTCVGIMDDGRLGFVVIDGRQENYSSGTTGRETADLLINLGFREAVMLDGGGSTQMIYEGITVNSPSSGPNGRPIAGGFMVIVD